MEFIVEDFIKSEKLLQILLKLLNPQKLFCKSQTSLQIQELSLNPEKYFANPKKSILSRVTCASSQPVSEFVPPFCRIQNGGGAGVSKELVIVYNAKYDVLP